MFKNWISNLKAIINNKVHIHHSHINGEIIDYVHSYRMEKVKISQKEKISQKSG